MNVVDELERLMTMQQVAARLNVPLPRVYDLARTKVLPVVHIGRQLRADRTVLEDWIAGGGSVRARNE